MDEVNLSLNEYPLRIWPDKALSTPTQLVNACGDDLNSLIGFLKESMYQLRGVGLAANQLGFNINVAVIDTSTAPVPTAEEVHRRPFFAMVNPKILLGEQLVSCEEGCLSVPVSRATISRFKVVDAQYVTPEGEQVTQRYEGITAFAVQHEIDHLGGKIFFSRASLLNRDIINRKLKKLRRQGR